MRRRYFGREGPCHTGLIISGLFDPDVLLEIEAVAVLDEDRAEAATGAHPGLMEFVDLVR